MTDAIAAREITITRVFDAPRELVWKSAFDRLAEQLQPDTTTRSHV